MVGRLEFHVPGKFDSFKQNKTKNSVALFLGGLGDFATKTKTSAAGGKLPRLGGGLTPHSSGDFACQSQLRFLLAGHAGTSFTSFPVFTEEHSLMTLS